MEYTRLGSTGLQVSRVCLGMMSYGSSSWREWVLDIDASRPLVRSAVEAADLVMQTTKVKHPMDAGQKGQRGIEW